MSSDNRKALLRQAFPELRDDLLEKLAKLAQERTYPPDTVLCLEGNHEDIFYVIVRGQVVFSKKMGEAEHIFRTGHAGEFFGEMALIDSSIGRSATVKTLQESTVLEIERGLFESTMLQSPELVIGLTRSIIKRMRENDRQSLEDLQNQNKQIESAYETLQRLNNQRNVFLTTLAHELRTPLTSVMGYMSLMRGGHMQGPALQMGLEKIGSGLDRMVSLINDLFFIQEIEGLTPTLKRLALKPILEEVVGRCEAYAKNQQVNVKLFIFNDLPDLEGDEEGLIRAFWHLLDNAIKFSPDGGDVLVNARAEAEKLVVEVIDHGVGIDPEFMPRLFLRFEREHWRAKRHADDDQDCGN